MTLSKLTQQGLLDGFKTLSSIRATLTARLSATEQRLGEAEAELLGLRQLLGALDMFRDAMHAEEQRRDPAALDARVEKMYAELLAAGPPGLVEEAKETIRRWLR